MTTSSSLLRRRTVLTAAGWTAPVIASTAIVPAYAASFPQNDEMDLAVTVTDPPFNWDTFENDYSVPVYAGGSNGRDRSNLTRVLTRAALPLSIVITNTGTTLATNPTGTVTTQLLDIGVDAVPVSAGTAKYMRVTTPQNSGFTVTDTNSTVDFGAALFNWRYEGTIEPGRSVEMPLTYYVHWPFTNVDFEVLVAATVIDDFPGEDENSDTKMGTVPGFIY